MSGEPDRANSENPRFELLKTPQLASRALTIPSHVDAIFSKKGGSWSTDERTEVLAWLTEKPQLRYALCLVFQWGGKAAADIVQDFWAGPLMKALEDYDPDRGRRMPGFLWMRFEFHCRKQIQQERESQRLQSAARFDQPNEDAQVELVDLTMEDPEQVSMAVEKFRLIVLLIEELRPRYREVIVRFYLKEQSISEIAYELKITIALVRVTLHRARQLLKQAAASRGIL